MSLLRSQSGHLSGMLLAKEQFKVEHNYQMGGVQCSPCLKPPSIFSAVNWCLIKNTVFIF